MKNVLRLLPVACVSLALLTGVGVAKVKQHKTAWMGVYTETLDKELADEFDLSTNQGAVINKVVHDSPADKAGLQDDDVIILFGGTEVRDAEDLTDLVQEHDPGDEIEIVILRDGKKKTLKLTLGVTKTRKGDYAFVVDPDVEDHEFLFLSKGDRPYVGIVMSGLSEQLGDYFGVAHGEGALITEVTEDSPAEKAGLKAGDIIVALDDEGVFDPKDVTEIILDMEKGDSVVFAIVRDKKERTVEVEVDEGEDPGFYWKGLDVQVPDMALWDLYIPHLKDLKSGSKQEMLKYFDSDEFKEEMEELRRELKEMKKELQELKEESH
jgi:C-terminal processing protease CtpA/Prc